MSIPTAHYYYLANSALVSDIDFFNGASWKMRASKSYDPLNRLAQATSSSADGTVLSYGFQYNDANQRTRVRMPDGSSWLYEYDELGQVVSGKRYWADGTPVAGQQFECAFDDIGNRNSTKAGGDSSGGNLRSASYSNDLLNQLTERQVPGAVDITGISHAQATTRVNGQAPYRYGEYFHLVITTNNGSGPVWLNVTNTAWLSGVTNSQTGHVYLAKSPEAYGYDEDGNLTSDGRWTYTWDAENRLLSMEGLTSLQDALRQKITFVYDWQGRRISKTVSNWNPATSNYQLSTEPKFLYDGWNLVAMLNSDLSFQNSFLWGLDASGSLQGAGGVGGLLSMTIHSGSLAGTYFCCYDGNYNVVGLARGSDGVMLTRYEYGPFGEVIRATGPLAAANPFHFSTKFEDAESGFLYYGFRSYNPSTGCWLSRDPIGEKGGANIYAFVLNDPVGYFDLLGLEGCTLSYSFDDDEQWWERTAYRSGTRWLNTLEQTKRDIKEHLKKGCCCIKKIYFTQHNGVPGTLALGEGTISMTIVRRIQAEADQARAQALQESIQREQDFLNFVRKFMCKGGRVVFVQCSAGAGPQGEELKKWLQQLLGPNVDVTLYANGVRWFYGRPKECTTRGE